MAKTSEINGHYHTHGNVEHSHQGGYVKVKRWYPLTFEGTGDDGQEGFQLNLVYSNVGVRTDNLTWRFVHPLDGFNCTGIRITLQDADALAFVTRTRVFLSTTASVSKYDTAVDLNTVAVHFSGDGNMPALTEFDCTDNNALFVYVGIDTDATAELDIMSVELEGYY